MELYDRGSELSEDEYLLKIQISNPSGRLSHVTGRPNAGFLSKLNKDGSIPKPFEKWGRSNTEIHVFKETFRAGWRLHSFRVGKSQNWAVVISPEGFTLEIYLQELKYLLKEISTVNGLMLGKFKWTYGKLLKL